jgi:hypothetical protein
LLYLPWGSTTIFTFWRFPTVNSRKYHDIATVFLWELWRRGRREQILHNPDWTQWTCESDLTLRPLPETSSDSKNTKRQLEGRIFLQALWQNLWHKKDP